MTQAAVSDTMKNKIDAWLDKDCKYTFFERIELLAESEHLFEDEPFAQRYGKTLAYILERVSTPIQADDVLLGRVAERIPSPEEWEQTEAVYRSWWQGKSDEQIQRDISWFYSDSWLRCRPPWFYSFGHLALDWELLVTEGLEGFERLARLSGLEQRNQDERNFLEGVALCHEAICAYFLRYAQAAEDAGRQEDADSLRHLSQHAPRSFKEALQVIWLLSLVVQKVGGCGVLNFSRMDQYLYPLYQADLDKNVLTPQSARELLQEFYYFNNEIMANTDHMSLDKQETLTTLEVAFDDPNYIILGGLLPDRTSGVNELTTVMVQAAEDLKLKNPFIVVRLHEGISDAFLLQVSRAMRDNTTIILYNDDKMIPALRRVGIEEPELYNYGFFGCNDPIIPAQEGGLRQLWLNLARPLELALNQGDYPLEPGGKNRDPYVFPLRDRMIGLMTGPYYGTQTPALEDMKSMDDMMSAYREQLRFLMRNYRQGIEHDVRIEAEANAGRLRIEDCYLRGTLENAVTWNNGGTKYHHYVVQASGLATVADALYAIEEMVFKQKRLTLSELNEILLNNWEGQEDLRKDMLHLPKYGNDDEVVDKYATFVSEVFTDVTLEQDQGDYLYKFYPTLSSDRDFTTMGYYVGATPDGRRQRDPISENQSPSEGADVSGITALLNSVSRIRFDRITGGPLNIRLHPSAVQGEEGAEILAALLKTYMQKGGLQVQLNVVDSQTLRAAQKEPEKYKNLCVRVTGYSAFFTQMGPKAQDELIRRTEQTV